jgi:hypothetical protein
MNKKVTSITILSIIIFVCLSFGVYGQAGSVKIRSSKKAAETKKAEEAKKAAVAKKAADLKKALSRKDVEKGKDDSLLDDKKKGFFKEFSFRAGGFLTPALPLGEVADVAGMGLGAMQVFGSVQIPVKYQRLIIYNDVLYVSSKGGVVYEDQWASTSIGDVDFKTTGIDNNATPSGFLGETLEMPDPNGTDGGGLGKINPGSKDILTFGVNPTDPSPSACANTGKTAGTIECAGWEPFITLEDNTYPNILSSTSITDGSWYYIYVTIGETTGASPAIRIYRQMD